jgi:hypothetical protein
LATTALAPSLETGLAVAHHDKPGAPSRTHLAPVKKAILKRLALLADDLEGAITEGHATVIESTEERLEPLENVSPLRVSRTSEHQRTLFAATP